jgi:hypothetical protein
VVALAPLPFGSVDIIWISVWYTLLVCSVASVTLRELRASMYLLAPALVLLAGLILIVRLPTLSPPVRVEPYALWHRTQELLEQPVPACVSAEAGRPWIALGAPLGMFLGFVAAFVNATDRVRAHLLFKSIAVSAAAYAAYGMFAHILIRHLCSGPRSRCFHKRLGDLRE